MVGFQDLKYVRVLQKQEALRELRPPPQQLTRWVVFTFKGQLFNFFIY